MIYIEQFMCQQMDTWPGRSIADRYPLSGYGFFEQA